MFSHVMVGSNDIDRSKSFYDTLFEALGGKPGRVDPRAASCTCTAAPSSW